MHQCVDLVVVVVTAVLILVCARCNTTHTADPARGNEPTCRRDQRRNRDIGGLAAGTMRLGHGPMLGHWHGA